MGTRQLRNLPSGMIGRAHEIRVEDLLAAWSRAAQKFRLASKLTDTMGNRQTTV